MGLLRIRLASYLVILLGVIFVLSSCGQGEDKQSSPTASSSPVRPETTASVIPSSPSPTVSAPTATVALAVSGSPLDRAILLPWYELDNLRYGGTFREGVASSTAVIDPYRDSSGAIHSAARWFYEKLVNWEPDKDTQTSHMVPMLSESWKVSDDLKTYTFTLRKGIKWQNVSPANGRELVAEDIVFNINRSMKPDAVRYPDYSQIANVSAPDKYTIVVNLKEPNAWLLNEAFGYTDYIVLPELVAQQTDGVLKTEGISTGPFILKEYRFRRGATYIRNPDYWRKDSNNNTLPYLDTIEQTLITDTATIVAGIRTNQLDSSVSDKRAIIALANSMPGIRIYSTTQPGGSAIAFNTRKAPWNDVKLRRALNMAIDKKKFGDATSVGPWVYVGPLPWSLFSSSPMTLNDLGPYYRYDSTESKKLRVEAGFSDAKVKIGNLVFTPAIVADPARAQVLQDLWKSEGIEVDLKSVDASTFYTCYYQRCNDDIAFTYIRTGDTSLPSYANRKFTPNATENTAYINDPDVNKILKEIKTTTDPAKLKEFARVLWDFDTLGSWNIWLPADRPYTAFAPRVRNYTARHNPDTISPMLYLWVADGPRTSP